MWNYFYNGTMRKYIIMFGRMFNDIEVVRYNKDGTAGQTIPVPIAYGPKDKWLVRLDQDPGLDKGVAIQLPRLGFELITMQYAPDRAVNKMMKSKSADGTKAQFSPIPYDFNIALYGMFSFNEDAVQVTEQIAPFFRPEWTQSLKLIPDIGDYYDIPVVLNDLSIEDSYDSDFLSRRSIVYTWNFTVKGYLFGPVSNKGVIKRAFTNMIAQPSGNAIDDSTTEPQHVTRIQPGLTSGGVATTDSSESVALTNINVDDDWGFAFDSFDFFDGANHDDDVR